ncbi:hypothetical protein GIB67_015260 [Kingdonia uniflora]|uniref:FMR1-interacting protein 1 conserved domain-containing protein n=1 Tax=Kingdonia uniflora TaxID=39325 RepID=A0A7J7MSX5_9MAGN|nr:hypothetical protein GIB67_015260 [Kingdonia uniflora]
MFPFRPSAPQLPNQTKTDGNNTSAPKQVVSSNSCIPNSNNLGSIQAHQFNSAPDLSQLLAFNHQFPVPFNVSNTHFLNVPNQYQPSQNSHISMSHLGLGSQNFNNSSGQFYPQTPHPGGQLFVHNCPQVGNQARPMQLHGCTMLGGQINAHSFQNMNQMCSLQQGFFPQNSIGLPQFASFNPTFIMNPQLGMMNTNNNAQRQHMFVPPTMGQNGLQGSSAVAHDSLKNSHLPDTISQVHMQQAQKNMQSEIFQGSQDHHAAHGGSNISIANQKNVQNNDFTRHPRFQKSKCHSMANGKGNFKPFNGKGGKGYREVATEKSHLSNSTKHPKVESQRSQSSNYTEKEILQWRQERRKNHPSRTNIEKLATKQTNAEVIDSDARRRRQELKEILAKQAELGVEIAEIPSNYLVETDNQAGEKEEDNNATGTKKGRFKNKYGKRQRNSKGGRFAKRQKFGENGETVSSPTPALNKSKPTLLQKLLSVDIKRDKSHLLQVLRFMVLNFFFKDFPRKPLEYPSVKVKDREIGNGNVQEKSSPLALVKKIEGQNGHVTTNNDDEDDGDHDDCAKDEEIVNGFVGKTKCIQVGIKSEAEEGEISD